MLNIVEARHLGEYKIHLRYANGAEGVVDFVDQPRQNMLAPWSDIAYFASFTINSDFATLEWPNGADISPEFLYSKVTGVPQEAAFMVMMGEQAKLNAMRGHA